MGTRLEGTNYQRQVVPERVLLQPGDSSQRFVAPIMVHKLFEVVCSKLTKQQITTVNQLIADGRYKSRSDLMRTAITNLLKTHEP